MNETTRNSAVAGLIVELEKACTIINALDDEIYSGMGGHESSIGAHMRHNLEFVNELLNGIAERRIDYNARLRDIRVEIDRGYAVEQMSFACQRLSSLTAGILATVVLVSSEVDEDVWHTSSVSREIEFLHSHTIHHYALVARRMADAGFTTDDTFGVAPSTLKFRAAAQSLRDLYAATN